MSVGTVTIDLDLPGPIRTVRKASTYIFEVKGERQLPDGRWQSLLGYHEALSGELPIDAFNRFQDEKARTDPAFIRWRPEELHFSRVLIL